MLHRRSFSAGSTISHWSDRFNYSWLAGLLVLAALVTFLLQSFAGSGGHSASCWAPAIFSPAMVRYAEDFCADQDSYYPVERDDSGLTNRPQRRSTYYRWLPLILLFQAFLFYLPHLVWRTILFFEYGLDVSDMTSIVRQTLDDERDAPSDHRREENDFNAAAAELHDRLTEDRGSVLVNCGYIWVKSLYAANALVQLAWINQFLAGPGLFYGVQMLAGLLSGGADMPEAAAMPQTVMCDFEIRTLGQIHRHTIQCTLPANRRNQVLLTVVWFLLLISFLLNAWQLLYWLMISLFTYMRVNFVERYARGFRAQRALDETFVWNFAANFLGPDAVLWLRLMVDDLGPATVRRLVHGLLTQHAKYHGVEGLPAPGPLSNDASGGSRALDNRGPSSWTPGRNYPDLRDTLSPGSPLNSGVNRSGFSDERGPASPIFGGRSYPPGPKDLASPVFPKLTGEVNWPKLDDLPGHLSPSPGQNYFGPTDTISPGSKLNDNGQRPGFEDRRGPVSPTPGGQNYLGPRVGQVDHMGGTVYPRGGEVDHRGIEVDQGPQRPNPEPGRNNLGHRDENPATIGGREGVEQLGPNPYGAGPSEKGWAEMGSRPEVVRPRVPYATAPFEGSDGQNDY